MNIGMAQILAIVVPLVGLFGLGISATTRSNRQKWSRSMAVFLAVLVVGLALFPILWSVPPPP